MQLQHCKFQETKKAHIILMSTTEPYLAQFKTQQTQPWYYVCIDLSS